MVKILKRINFVVWKNLTETAEKTGLTDTTFLTVFRRHISEVPLPTGAVFPQLSVVFTRLINPGQNFSPTGQVTEQKFTVSIFRFPCNSPVNPDHINSAVSPWRRCSLKL